MYNGTGTTVNITGLSTGTTYQLMTQEYNGMTGNQIYKTTIATGNPATVITPTPTIIYTGSLSPETTQFGTASWPGGSGYNNIDQFTVSGSTLAAGITVTAPAGYEVSTHAHSGFSSSLLIGTAGNVAATTVYIRLTASTNATTTPYTGNVSLTSLGSPTNPGPAISGVVSPYPFGIQLINGPYKTYGQILATNQATGYLPTGVNNDYITGATETPDATGMSPTAAVGAAYTVTASQATGNSSFILSNYTMSYSPYQGNVTPAPLVITGNNTTRVYGTVLPAATSSQAFTSATLQNNETVGSVAISYPAGDHATDGVGTYAGSPTPAAATGGTFTPSNYQITYVAGSMTVTPAPLSVSAGTSATTKTYGTTLNGGAGATSFTSTGLLNNDQIGTVSISYGAGAAGTSAVGIYAGSVTSYAATGGTFNAGNYTVTYPASPLSIIPAGLVITAVTTPKTYGAVVTGASGSTAFTNSVLQNGETLTSVTTAYGPGATAGYAVGTYTGSATVSSVLGGSTFTASNYSITYNSASLLVSQAPLVITATNTTRIYGTILAAVTSSTAFTSATLQNNETIGSVSLSYPAGDHATDGVGTYAGSPTPAGATGGTFTPSNYQITYVAGSMIVTPAPLSIQTGISKSYGVVLTGGAGYTSFTATGLLNSDYIGSITVQYGQGSAANDPVGVYSTVISSAATGGTFNANNYTTGYVTGSIYVLQKTAYINAVTVNKSYGTLLTNSTYTTYFTVAGIASGEYIASVNMTFDPVAAASAEPVGSYPATVTPSGATGGSYSGNTFAASNYNFIYASGPVQVNQEPLMITANAVSKAYGLTISGASGQTGFTSTGLVNGETLGTVTLAYGSGSAATDAANTYAASVMPSQETGGTILQSNYQISYSPANLIVTASNLSISITADATTKSYGLVLTGFSGSGSFTSSGLLNGDKIGSVSIAYGAGAPASAPVASYPGSVSGSSATGGTFNPSNYTISYNVADLDVIPSALVITASAVSKVYGAVLTGASGSTAFTHSALQNAETLTSVTLSYGSGAAGSSVAGTYTGSVSPSSAIGGSGFSAGNYSIVYTPGDLTVTPAPLDLTAIGITKSYGAQLPGATATTNFTEVGLQNGDMIQQVTQTLGSAASSSAAAATYPSQVVQSDAIGTNFQISNYSVTYHSAAIIVLPTALTITATDQSKVFGATLSGLAGASGSTYFTYPVLPNSETIGSVSLAYAAGSAGTDGAGDYSGSVTASNAARGSFIATNYTISYTPAKLTVTPLTLTIAANGVSKVYGATLSGASGQTGFTSTPLANSDVLNTVSLAYSTAAATTAAPVGSYPGAVSPSQATGNTSFNISNYSILYTSGTVTIGQTPLDLTAAPVTKSYGAQLPGTTQSTNFTAAGLQNGDMIQQITQSQGTGSASNAAVGTYPGKVVPGSPTGANFVAGNYAITYHNADLIVVPAALIITAAAQSKFFGSAMSGVAPASGATYFTYPVLPNSETVGSVSITFGSGSAATDAVGDYSGSVTASNAAGGSFTPTNYTISYLPAILSVTPLPLTITATGVTKVYGATLNAASGQTGFTSTPLANSDGLTTVSLGYNSLAAAAAAAADSYPGAVTPSQAMGNTSFSAGNYTISYASGTVIVSQAPLDLTAAPVTKSYGDQLAATAQSTSFTPAGLKNGDLIQELTQTQGTGSAASAAVGTYPGQVVPGNPTGVNFLAGNYAITYHNADLIVLPLALTITAAAQSKVFGATLSGLTGAGSPVLFTYPALPNSETVGSVSIGYGAGAAGTEAAGDYPGSVTAYNATGGSFVSSNYAITYLPALLIVMPSQLIITATGAGKVYGATLSAASGQPGFTFTPLANTDVLNSVSLGYSAQAAAPAAPAGTYPGAVTPSQALGNASFNASNYTISYASGTVTVSQAHLDLTAVQVTKSYGVQLPGTVQSAAFITAGLQNGDLVQQVSQTQGTGSASNAAVGNYPGQVVPGNPAGPSFLAGNYSITYHSASILVTPAPLVITAPAQSKIYGPSNLPSGSTTVLVTGLVTGDDISSVALAYGPGSADTDPAGTYSGSVSVAGITGGSGFMAGNYSINYINASLTVSPAALSITTGPVFKVYGTTLTASPGVQAFTSTPLKNGETVVSVSSSYGNGSAGTAPVGIYPGQAGSSLATGTSFLASNYSITYNTADITVTQATLAIIATGPARVYGTALSATSGASNFTVSTLMNGENIAGVTLTPDLQASTYNTAAGLNYTVTPSAATGSGSFLPSNYQISYIPYTGTITPAPLTITATAPGKVYGTSLTATSVATGFSSTAVASGEAITSVTLNRDAAGQSAATAAGVTYTVTPSAATGNPAFHPANYTINYVPLTSLVTPAPLTVAAISVSKVYGTALSGVTGSSLFTAAGLQNTDRLTAATISYTTGAAPEAPVAVYATGVGVSSVSGPVFNAANYTISYTPATLTVTPASLVLTASILNKGYGTTLGSTSGLTTFTFAGLQNHETIGSVSSSPGTGASATSPVGVYPGSGIIYNATGGNFVPANYTISYLPAAIVVNKATLSILALDVTKNYSFQISGSPVFIFL